MLPVIGITSSTKVVDGYSYDAVLKTYIKAVEDNHGVPMILPLVWQNKIRLKIFSLIDGLLLTGAAEIDPTLYNEEPASFGMLDKDRDDFEMAITRFALKNKVPMLGVCRGLQLLAVACGGSLYQDLSHKLVKHKQDIKFFRNGILENNEHEIYLCSGTRIIDIYGKKVIKVTSSHYQAVKEIPKGFILSAYAEDGAIEAIEKEGGDHFCVGVQYRPEEIDADSIQQKLFRAFVNACSQFKTDRQVLTI